MINLMIIPETEMENFPSRLIFPFNSEDDVRLVMSTLLDITNAGVKFTTKIVEDIMEQECEM